MASVVMNIFKGQRMDITAQMKDADKILEAFRKNNIRFDKKYTSINGKGPSTITFKGIKAEQYHSDITKMVVSLYEMTEKDEIANVYVKFTSFNRFKRPFNKDEEKIDTKPSEIEVESVEMPEDISSQEIAESTDEEGMPSYEEMIEHFEEMATENS